MPEPSLTEEAAITTDGHVLASSTPAAAGVDVAGMPSRTAGPSPMRGMTIDAHEHVDDDPMSLFHPPQGCPLSLSPRPADGKVSMSSVHPDMHSLMELLAERDIPGPIHCDQTIFAPPRRIEKLIAPALRVKVIPPVTWALAALSLSVQPHQVSISAISTSRPRPQAPFPRKVR